MKNIKKVDKDHNQRLEKYGEKPTEIIEYLEGIADWLNVALNSTKSIDKDTANEAINYIDSLTNLDFTEEEELDDKILSYGEYLRGGILSMAQYSGSLEIEGGQEVLKEKDWVSIVNKVGVRGQNILGEIKCSDELFKIINQSKYPWAMALGFYQVSEINKV